MTEEWTGVVTYTLKGDQCEIISLDSLEGGRGIGTAMINAVVQEAQSRHCRRVFLSTTNDNLHALGFYQKRGFELAAIRRGAVDESRKIKPGIPLIGENGIAVRDEIELEMSLNTQFTMGHSKALNNPDEELPRPAPATVKHASQTPLAHELP